MGMSHVIMHTHKLIYVCVCVCVCVHACVCVCVYAHNMQEGSHAQLILQTVTSAAQSDMHSTVRSFVP